MSISRLLMAASFIPLSLAARPAFAAEPQAAEGSGSIAAIDEIVVTARRREERLQDVPVAVSSFSGNELREQGLVSVGDLERLTPSLQVHQQMGGSTSQTVSLRGQAQADILLTTDASVGLYSDDVNIPRTINLRSTMFDVERVEVLRGPQGTLYGRNTTGGAISIVSRAPDFDGIHGFVEGSLGKYDAREIGGAVNIPLVDEKLALRLAGQFRTRDGYAKDIFTGREASDERSEYLRARILFKPTENIDVSWTTDWNHSRDRGYTPRLRTIGAAPFSTPAHITNTLINYSVATGVLNPRDIPSAANGGVAGPTFASGLLAGYAGLSRFVDGNGFIGFHDTAIGGPYPDGSTGGASNELSTWGTGLRIDFDLGDVRLASITGYREMDRHSRADLDATPVATLQSAQDTRDHFLSQELQLSGQAFDDRLNYLIGLYYSRERGSEESDNIGVGAINPNNPTRSLGDVKNVSYAVYTQGTYKLTPVLSLTLGGRYTIEKKSLVSHNIIAVGSTPDPTDFRCTVPPGNLPISNCSGSVGDTFKDPSWLASIDYKLDPNVLLYAKASQSFRGGGTNLRATDARAFQAFKPEVAREYEAGMKAEFFERRLRLNVAAFVTDYSDIQRTSVIPSSTGGVTTSITNAASAKIRGLEIEATARPVPALTLTAGASFLDPKYKKFTDINPATGLPRDRSNDDFGTFNGISRTQLSASARYEVPVGDSQLAFQAGVYYQGRTPNMTVDVDRTFNRRDVDVASYALVNARISYLLSSGVEFAVFGENLTDKKYYTGIQDLSSLGYILASAGDPRTFGVSVKVPFGGER